MGTLELSQKVRKVRKIRILFIPCLSATSSLVFILFCLMSFTRAFGGDLGVEMKVETWMLEGKPRKRFYAEDLDGRKQHPQGLEMASLPQSVLTV